MAIDILCMDFFIDPIVPIVWCTLIPTTGIFPVNIFYLLSEKTILIHLSYLYKQGESMWKKKGKTFSKHVPAFVPKNWSTPCPPFSQGIPAALHFFLTSQPGKCWSPSRFQGRRLLCCPTFPPCADSVCLLAVLFSVAPHVNSWPFGRGTALEQQWEAEDNATNTQLCWFSSCGKTQHNEKRKQTLQAISREIHWIGLDPREASSHQ